MAGAAGLQLAPAVGLEIEIAIEHAAKFEFGSQSADEYASIVAMDVIAN